jgi:hypothetical protein
VSRVRGRLTPLQRRILRRVHAGVELVRERRADTRPRVAYLKERRRHEVVPAPLFERLRPWLELVKCEGWEVYGLNQAARVALGLADDEEPTDGEETAAA